MLYGGYDHNVDKKGRVFIPAKFRDDLGETFIICRGISGKRCLCVYPFSEWEKLVAKISELPSSQASGIKRFIFDGASSGFLSAGTKSVCFFKNRLGCAPRKRYMLCFTSPTVNIFFSSFDSALKMRS